MYLIDIALLAVALSMDAFAVALCKGLAQPTLKPCQPLLVGLWFGGFQAIMPFLGYFVGAFFERSISSWVPWLAFALLLCIGLNMIRESFSKAEEADPSLRFLPMLGMAIATSIDALAAGVTFPAMDIATVGRALTACLSIGLVTFFLSAAGVRVGHFFGHRWRRGAELCGGIILILLGVKALFARYLPF